MDSTHRPARQADESVAPPAPLAAPAASRQTLRVIILGAGLGALGVASFAIVRFMLPDRPNRDVASSDVLPAVTVRSLPTHPDLLVPQPVVSPEGGDKPADNHQDVTEEQRKFFEAKIRPVLADRCYSCHSARSNKLRGNLRLDTRDGMRQGGDSGPAVVPADVEKSLLIKAIRFQDPDFAMPPKNAGGKLDDAVIRDLEAWVKMGAPDPRDGSTPVVQKDPNIAKTWWAYQPVSKPNVPDPKNRNWSRSEIDRFVLDKLERTGLEPVADAAPLVLLRRISFDLIGLPPTPEEARAFLAAWQSAQNPQTVLTATVDRLLSSPQFGERWGRHWLDVARFAESSGKDVNVVFPHAWRYRDYVIRSFNDDVPYDRFLREQIAGDLLPAKDDAERAKQVIAAGFLALGAKSLNEITPRQFAVDVADEQIDTVSQAILGLTIACARCHDHKFDPISQREYTALAGIFLSTETKFGTPGGVQGRNLSTLVELPKGAAAAVVAKGMTREERQRKQERLDQLREQHRQALAARAGGKTPNDGLTNFDIVRIITQATQLEVELSGVYADGTPKPLAMSVADKPLTAPPVPPRPGRRQSSGFEALGDSPLFGRGDIANPGEKVARGIPPLFASVALPAIPLSASGRRELADWLTDARNPLTARVMANRTWHWLFGRGLVPSVDNFGTMGSPPSHPELLDYLAGRFMADGWSVKKLVRAIVLSRTYQLAATHHVKNVAADPENALLWRHSPRRLDAEAIRDTMLAAAGTLDLKAPTASLIARAGDGPIGGERFQAITAEQVARAEHSYRSVYLPIARNVQPDVLAVFDFPDAASVCGARGVTNVPNQALFFLNSDFAAKKSARLTERLLQGNPGGTLEHFDERFERACWSVLGRPPEPAEKTAARKLLARYEKDAQAGWTRLVRGLFATAEFRFLD